ncbi:MAG: TetR/AcrR family transcriptional regulator [Actinomycetota bacterium]
MPTGRTMESGTRLSRGALVDASLAIVAEEGPDALTLRRLGTELGADPTALYRNFRDKDELLTAMADRLLIHAIEGLRPTGAWREDLRAMTLRMRAVYLAHPRLAQVVAGSSSPFPNEQRLSETTLSVLRSAGLSDEEAVRTFEVLESYTIAVSTLDAGAAPESDERWRRSFAALDPDSYPSLTALAPLLYRDADATFEYGLDLLLEAVAARVGDRPT